MAIKLTVAQAFAFQLREVGLEKVFIPEYKFHPTRKWRFDYADPVNKVAIEISGAVWRRGRHQRGGGFIKDIEKYNEATIRGWRLLQYADVIELSKFPSQYHALTSGGLRDTLGKTKSI